MLNKCIVSYILSNTGKPQVFKLKLEQSSSRPTCWDRGGKEDHPITLSAVPHSTQWLIFFSLSVGTYRDIKAERESERSSSKLWHMELTMVIDNGRKRTILVWTQCYRLIYGEEKSSLLNITTERKKKLVFLDWLYCFGILLIMYLVPEVTST